MMQQQQSFKLSKNFLLSTTIKLNGSRSYSTTTTTSSKNNTTLSNEINNNNNNNTITSETSLSNHGIEDIFLKNRLYRIELKNNENNNDNSSINEINKTVDKEQKQINNNSINNVKVDKDQLKILKLKESDINDWLVLTNSAYEHFKLNQPNNWDLLSVLALQRIRLREYLQVISYLSGNSNNNVVTPDRINQFMQQDPIRLYQDVVTLSSDDIELDFDLSDEPATIESPSPSSSADEIELLKKELLDVKELLRLSELKIQQKESNQTELETHMIKLGTSIESFITVMTNRDPSSVHSDPETDFTPEITKVNDLRKTITLESNQETVQDIFHEISYIKFNMALRSAKNNLTKETREFFFVLARFNDLKREMRKLQDQRKSLVKDAVSKIKLKKSKAAATATSGGNVQGGINDTLTELSKSSKETRELTKNQKSIKDLSVRMGDMTTLLKGNLPSLHQLNSGFAFLSNNLGQLNVLIKTTDLRDSDIFELKTDITFYSHLMKSCNRFKDVLRGFDKDSSLLKEKNN